MRISMDRLGRRKIRKRKGEGLDRDRATGWKRRERMEKRN